MSATGAPETAAEAELGGEVSAGSLHAPASAAATIGATTSIHALRMRFSLTMRDDTAKHLVTVDSVFDWLVDGAPGAQSPAEVIQRLGTDLRSAGVPVDRAGTFVRTLHPTVRGRAFMWTFGEPVQMTKLDSTRELPGAASGPVGQVVETGKPVRRDLADRGPGDFPVFAELHASGYRDYLALPLPFSSGQTQVIVFATKATEGFGDEHVAALARIARPLARVAEVLELRRTATNLLSTYVGRDAGDRVLSGRIMRGDVEMLRAVIWFSDVRGFTELLEAHDARAIVGVLNEVFDCQVAAIEKHGGEVLKFIGDGLLAIFPYEVEGERKLRAEAALAATDDAFAALEHRNQAAKIRARFGLALHDGEVAYGNIGGSDRLDFTAIGSAVNLAARLEGLTGKLDVPLVMSEAFAKSAGRPLIELGSFKLKGVTGESRVFAPAR
ncbi:MAG: adenylate/guanylate cyclase domain-containing protein [Myxococcales bacterium]|nr:adenylate/guanylate cyclase domain-containing protein [Myxococcales bacterium]